MIPNTRIHLFGAPGSGVSTIGRELAAKLDLPYFDTDDFVWFTTDELRYRRRRNTQHRLQFLNDTLAPYASWVLGGSLCGWGDSLITEFDLVVYLNATTEVREARILVREQERYGAERIAAGGDLFSVFQKFLVWASEYDAPPNHAFSDTSETNIRSGTAERQWLTDKIGCRVLKFDTGTDSSVKVVDTILLDIFE
jgi:adenylate kinase family enzyme